MGHKSALSSKQLEELVPEYAPKTACVVLCDKLGSGLGMITLTDDPGPVGWRYYGWTPRAADECCSD
jgi:hypothetical protein